MTISSIHTDNAAQPIGPYQQACLEPNQGAYRSLSRGFTQNLIKELIKKLH